VKSLGPSIEQVATHIEREGETHIVQLMEVVVAVGMYTEAGLAAQQVHAVLYCKTCLTCKHDQRKNQV
jgi:hypothetical protein